LIFRLLLVILAFSYITFQTLPVHAESQTITAKHTYFMGDSDSKDQARTLCFLVAKQKVLNKAGVFIESSSEINSFKLSKDQIKSYSATILRVEIIEEKFRFANGVNSLMLTVSAKVDMEDVRRRFTEIDSNEDLKARVNIHQQQILKLEQQIQALNNMLGLASERTKEQVRKDRDAELRAYNHLGAERGEGEVLLIVPRDYTQVVMSYQKVAAQGDAWAQYNLGGMYAEGKGVPQDYTQAVAWYRKAADQSNVKAQHNLGWMYAEGKGVPQDYTQAVMWYRKAAEQGYAWAQYSLGGMYAEGKGVPQDYTQAAMWYRKAAEQGDTWAEYRLGRIYAEGKDVLPH